MHKCTHIPVYWYLILTEFRCMFPVVGMGDFAHSPSEREYIVTWGEVGMFPSSKEHLGKDRCHTCVLHED